MKKIMICFATCAFVGVAMAQVRVNQVGFAPASEKTATIESVADAKPLKVTVLDQQGKKVWKGKAQRVATSPISGKVRQVVDFSALQKEGTYRLLVGKENDGVSAEVVVKESPFAELSKAALKGFYLQRASMPIEEQYAGCHARPAGHMDTVVLVHPSAATPERPAGTVISGSKGWYDAGDYNKYIVNSGFAIGVMLGAYERNKAYFQQQVADIPESGNGVPDLLDEVYYNIQWMQTMQDTDGGLYHKLTTPNFEGFVAPVDCHQPRYVVMESTAASLDFAASMAQASRIYKEYESAFPGFSATALEQAERAYAWAKAHPNVAYEQGKMNEKYDPDVNTGEYGDHQFADEFFWASTELYMTTGKDEYRVDALENMPKWFTPATWGSVAELGILEWAFLKTSSVGDSKIAADMKTMLLDHLKPYLAQVGESCFQSPYGNEAKDFFWGCNSEGCAWRGSELLYAYGLTGEASYHTAAYECMNYLLGQNATGYCYVTGFGTNPSKHPHQRLSAVSTCGALPGFLVGGPNPGQQDKGDHWKYTSDFADESYMDHEGSYASNEIAINWNATLVALAALLDK